MFTELESLGKKEVDIWPLSSTPSQTERSTRNVFFYTRITDHVSDPHLSNVHLKEKHKKTPSYLTKYQ